MLQFDHDQLMRTALAYHGNGRLDQAEQLLRQILADRPDHDEALHQLGVVVGQSGRLEEAAELIKRAAVVCPTNVVYHNNLGLALHAMNRLDEAVASYQQALQYRRDIAAVHYNLGNSLLALRRYDQAIAAYRQTLQLDAGYGAAFNHIGVALHAQGQLDAARGAFRQAIQLQSNNAEALYNLGNSVHAQGNMEEAIACFQRALDVNPRYGDALNSLGAVLKDVGRLDEAVACRRRAMEIQPHNASFHSSLIMSLLYHPESTGPSLLAECRKWNQRHAEPHQKEIRPHANSRDPGKRLRIGYVSMDFRQHPVALNMIPLFSAHDHTHFEIFCYSGVRHADEITARCRGNADVWREIADLSGASIADLIRQDGIDILVDLGLHSGWGNLLVFARQPAPVQVAFAGYPGTTGLDTIAYRLTDPFLDPPTEANAGDSDYSEQSIRLPDSFWCFDPVAPEITVNPLPAQAKGFLTFGSLTNFGKVNAGVLRLWSRALNAVANSQLLMLAPEGGARSRVLEILGNQGIASERVHFAPRTSRTDYLRLYHGVDIGLDTLPYNGHTTSLDSFWMGVPVITLVGQTVVGRAGLSQLMNLGLPELVGRTPDQFVQIAADLAGDLPRLADLRSTLRQRMERSPLMDGVRFARNLEAAYRRMWLSACT